MHRPSSRQGSSGRWPMRTASVPPWVSGTRPPRRLSASGPGPRTIRPLSPRAFSQRSRDPGRHRRCGRPVLRRGWDLDRLAVGDRLDGLDDRAEREAVGDPWRLRLRGRCFIASPEAASDESKRGFIEEWRRPRLTRSGRPRTAAAGGRRLLSPENTEGPRRSGDQDRADGPGTAVGHT
jgi:hypothetical protein